MAAGDDPIVLISPVVPTSVYQNLENEVKKGQVNAAMLVDQSYAQTAYNLKTSINTDLGKKSLSVFVKFGESATASGGQMNQVELFPLPGPSLGLSIDAIEYNTVKQDIEVTYSNTGNALEYVQPSMQVLVDGSPVGTVGDEQPFTVQKGQKVGRGYPIKIDQGNVSAKITAYFGSSKKSFENGIQVMMNAGRVQFIDSSSLNITSFNRDKSTDDLFVTFTNTGNVSEYFKAGASVEMNGSSTTINDDNTYQLAPGEGRMVKFPGVAKIGSNITASAQYGARAAFLDKSVQGQYAAQEAPADLLMPIVVIVLVILAVAAAFFFMGKKNEAAGEPKKAAKKKN
jgi:archaellum component FlaF (FlaF/FlaG flagellin family)